MTNIFKCNNTISQLYMSPITTKLIKHLLFLRMNIEDANFINNTLFIEQKRYKILSFVIYYFSFNLYESPWEKLWSNLLFL